MAYVFATVIGYLLGTSNMAYYLSKLKKTDLRERGTGNLGVMNAFMELGWPSAILTFVHDLGKASLAVLLTKWVFPKTVLASYVAAAACVLGHCFPFYLGFKGGKGFAPYGGAVLTLNPEFGFPMLAIVIVLIFLFDYVIVGNYATLLSYPVFLFAKGAWKAGLVAIGMGLLVGFMHVENIKKIRAGTETRVRSTFIQKLFKQRKRENPDDENE